VRWSKSQRISVLPMSMAKGLCRTPIAMRRRGALDRAEDRRRAAMGAAQLAIVARQGKAGAMHRRSSSRSTSSPGDGQQREIVAPLVGDIGSGVAARLRRWAAAGRLRRMMVEDRSFEAEENVAKMAPRYDTTRR